VNATGIQKLLVWQVQQISGDGRHRVRYYWKGISGLYNDDDGPPVLDGNPKKVRDQQWRRAFGKLVEVEARPLALGDRLNMPELVENDPGYRRAWPLVPDKDE
jgi:hypothetical protein